jgi:hypothetical protein
MPSINNKALHDGMTIGNVICLVLSWMLRLSDATATLEALGLAHGGIKAPNFLVDEWDRFKLIDLNFTLPIGSDLEVGDELHVRFHKPSEEGVRQGWTRNEAARLGMVYNLREGAFY